MCRDSTFDSQIQRASFAGVCTPYDSDACRNKNTWVSCEGEQFKCNALERENPAGRISIIPIVSLDRTRGSRVKGNSSDVTPWRGRILQVEYQLYQ